MFKKEASSQSGCDSQNLLHSSAVKSELPSIYSPSLLTDPLLTTLTVQMSNSEIQTSQISDTEVPDINKLIH